MKLQHMYLDLDRTLLDTEKLKKSLFKAVQNLYGIPAERLNADTRHFYTQTNGMVIYDFFNQLEAYGVDTSNAKRQLTDALADQDFLFDDAHSLLMFLRTASIPHTILSYGTQRYQHFKFSVVPPVHHIPFVVDLYKDKYLAAHAPASSAIVDDKIVTPLPRGCTQFLLDRTADVPLRQESPMLWRINTLKSVETVVSVGYNEPN